jgi:molybdate transport system ATP-binding protein
MDQQNLFTAQVISHDPDNQQTLTLARAYSETRYRRICARSEVCWMIQSSNVLLHRRSRNQW